jgi:uridylate kinase
MHYKFSKTVVVALGGSIVYPDGIDVQFLKDFKKFLTPFLKRGVKFVLVIGGGKLSRNFQEAAERVIRGKLKKLRAPVTIASGWRPGWSTDYVAMRIASDFGVGEAIIAGKPAHVYSKDNTKYADAVPFHELTWREYRKLIPAKWAPGLHAPVDPIGAALGAREGVKAIIVDGRNLPNFRALLNGKEFKGTIIG